jgi:hypothetical protein
MMEQLPPTSGESPDPNRYKTYEEEKVFRRTSAPFVFLRVCLYLILSTAVSYVLASMVHGLMPAALAVLSPRGLATSETIALAGVLTAAWAMARLERRSFGEYGLPARGAFGKRFWQGAFFGLLEISGVVGILALTGCYRFGVVSIHGVEMARWIIFWALVFLCVGLYEEFTFRGYVQFTLAQGTKFWPAAALLSLVFGGIHAGNPGETWPGLAGISVVGLLWCFTLRRTGNLWFAVGMHAAFDFGETFLYSVPDSGVILPGHLSNATIAGPTWLTGGTAGPEGSILDFIVLLAFFYVFHRLFPARKKTVNDIVQV